MIDRNHPAVEAAARVGRVSDEAEIAASEAYAQGVGERPFSQRMRAALTAALPHLTADDLRNTPAVADLTAGRDAYREFAFEVGGLQRALEDGELDLQHCDTRLVPTEEVVDWLGGLIERLRSGLIHLGGDA